MDGHEPGPARPQATDGLSPWPLWLAWLLLAIGVCWCWYATWHEAVAVSGFRYRASDGRVGDLGLGVDSVVSKWLPGAAASVSLDYHSVDTYTIGVSSILYFQRKMMGSALICSK